MYVFNLLSIHEQTENIVDGFLLRERCRLIIRSGPRSVMVMIPPVDVTDNQSHLNLKHQNQSCIHLISTVTSVPRWGLWSYRYKNLEAGLNTQRAKLGPSGAVRWWGHAEDQAHAMSAGHIRVVYLDMTVALNSFTKWLVSSTTRLRFGFIQHDADSEFSFNINQLPQYL